MIPPVLVDTSVWVNYFRGVDSFGTQTVDQLIDEEADLAVCGPVLMEMIQGCPSEREARTVEAYLGDLIYVATPEHCYRQTGRMYRQLRSSGVTIRKSIDCLIATIAIGSGLPLLADDRNFSHISAHTPLMLIGSS